MARKYILKSFIYLILAAIAGLPLAASEHHGAVKFAGLPVPGATVTATMGDKKLVAITDPAGVYSFPDLPEGVWNIQVEMLCFTTLKMEVASAANAPSPEWELKLMPFDEIKGSAPPPATLPTAPDRKSTRLNSSHVRISYAVFCLKKKKNRQRGDGRGSSVVEVQRRRPEHPRRLRVPLPSDRVESMPAEQLIGDSRSAFFFNDTATTEIYTLSLHDALPICHRRKRAAHTLGANADRIGELRVGGRHERSEEHTSELQSRPHLVCRLLLEKKKKNKQNRPKLKKKKKKKKQKKNQ